MFCWRDGRPPSAPSVHDTPLPSVLDVPLLGEEHEGPPDALLREAVLDDVVDQPLLGQRGPDGQPPLDLLLDLGELLSLLGGQLVPLCQSFPVLLLIFLSNLEVQNIRYKVNMMSLIATLLLCSARETRSCWPLS